MAIKQRPRQPKSPQGRRKIPLTYYRSSSSAAQPTSPFKRREVKQGRGRQFIVKSVDLLVLAVVVFGIVYSLMVKPDPVIKANDYSYHSAKAYSLAASAALNTAKNRTKMTLDDSGIAGTLEKQFPEISDVSVELPLVGQRPIIRIQVAPPTLFLTGSDQSYVVDNDGVAVAKSSDLPILKKLPRLEDQTGFDIKTGQQALSISSVKFIETLLAECKRAKVPINSMTLPPAPLELDLRTADKPYFVKFNLGGNALVQTGQFLAARHQFSLSGSGGPSQYLDVRVEGKVFYK